MFASEIGILMRRNKRVIIIIIIKCNWKVNKLGRKQNLHLQFIAFLRQRNHCLVYL